MKFRHALIRASLALALCFVTGTPSAVAQDTRAQRWIGTWATSPLRPDPVGVSDAAVLSRTGFEDQTLRQIVYPHFSGAQVRVRLSNTFGTTPLTIGESSIGRQSEAAALVAGSDRPLLFGGQSSVVIPPGAQVVSDPVALQVDATRTLAISLYLPGPTGPVTWHATARQTLFVAFGNHAADPAGTQFEAWTNVPSWYILSGVDVLATSPDQAAIVTFGDSITDGTASTQDANNRWPNYLARRLLAQPGNRLTVLDQGIAGNRVLTDTPAHVNGLARLDRDVLTQNGVKYVIFLLGINDIGQTCLGNANASAEDLIAGYKQIIAQVRLKGLKIYGGTLTPFKGTGSQNPEPRYYCDEGEVKRGIINNWVRTSGEFDAVIDFDQVTRDAGDPLMFNPAYDSGDHLHPSDAGYEAMANAIDLALFAP
jgi:lysophospholipase L1-like esterase